MKRILGLNPHKQAPMNPPLLRRTLGISAILLVVLITYRKSANGSNSAKNNGKLLSVTAAARLTGNQSLSPVLVKGLLRKNQQHGQIFLVDEDSVSTNPRPLSCRFSELEVSNLEGLSEDTELVVEGHPDRLGIQEGLSNCTIISINNGTVYTDRFPEH